MLFGFYWIGNWPPTFFFLIFSLATKVVLDHLAGAEERFPKRLKFLEELEKAAEEENSEILEEKGREGTLSTAESKNLSLSSVSKSIVENLNELLESSSAISAENTILRFKAIGLEAINSLEPIASGGGDPSKVSVATQALALFKQGTEMVIAFENSGSSSDVVPQGDAKNESEIKISVIEDVDLEDVSPSGYAKGASEMKISAIEDVDLEDVSPQDYAKGDEKLPEEKVPVGYAKRGKRRASELEKKVPGDYAEREPEDSGEKIPADYTGASESEEEIPVGSTERESSGSSDKLKCLELAGEIAYSAKSLLSSVMEKCEEEYDIDFDEYIFILAEKLMFTFSCLINVFSEESV